jgi:exoribonuclease II
MKRPESNEHDPYYIGYISQIADGDDLLEVMDAQPSSLRSLVSGVPEEEGTYSYAEGKWTVKELLSHIIDGERMFAYRMLRISRGDETPIEGFDQDPYIAHSHANDRSFGELVDEFELCRRANMLMMRNMTDEDAARIGTANEKQISARAIAYIMAGHVRHHENILKERYLG